MVRFLFFEADSVSFGLAGSASVRHRPLGVTEHFQLNPDPTDSQFEVVVGVEELRRVVELRERWC